MKQLFLNKDNKKLSKKFRKLKKNKIMKKRGNWVEANIMRARKLL